MKVLVSDPFAPVDDRRIQQVPLDELLGQSDYVVCLAIANEETENLMGGGVRAHEAARLLHQPVARQSGGRGGAGDGVRENRIAGAAMDVGRALDQMPSPELAGVPNVIATPHIGGLTPPAIEHQAFDTVRQVEDHRRRGAGRGGQCRAVDAPALARNLERF